MTKPKTKPSTSQSLASVARASDEWTRLELLRSVVGGQRSCDPRHPVVIGVCDLDDAALIQVTQRESLVIASDFIRGTGFYLAEMGLLSHFDLGYYLVVANISDIAAMGATPTGLATVIRYSPAMTDQLFREVFEGMRSAADAYGTPIVGGDIGGYASDVFCATAFGFVKTDRALRRSGARPGDILFLSGEVGLPITALVYFREAKPRGLHLKPEEEELLLKSWRRPAARVQEGIVLSRSGVATACQDVSDGLKATIEQIGKASEVGFTVDAQSIPIHHLTHRVADFLKSDPIALAFSASVDFSLLFTTPLAKVDRCERVFAAKRLLIHRIGCVTEDRTNLLRRDPQLVVPLPGVEWKQQTGNYLLEITKRGKYK